jgi:ATP-independent RNA helicase DbpA
MKNNFQTMNLSPEIMKVISETGFTEMTQIQSECIPLLLKGSDLIGQSKTGSGKTAAFVIPILQKINVNIHHPQALILCPTRELCDQVFKQAAKFSKYIKNLKVTALIGGRPMEEQERALANGVHLIVGTPGRVLEHFKNRNFKIDQLKTIVLDEADRLLDDAFSEEIKTIMDLLPQTRQTIFFSATFPEVMNELSQKYQNNPERITIKETEGSKLQIEQFVYAAEKPEKMDMLLKILKKHPSKCSLIFCRTKAAVDEIGKRLKQEKMTCEILHADLKQNDRDFTTAVFRKGQINVLVATDVAARGLDIDILELVINFDLPPAVDIYIHRIGRTGRAGRKGQAVSIATDYEKDLVLEIESKTAVKMIRPTL